MDKFFIINIMLLINFDLLKNKIYLLRYNFNIKKI